MLRWFVRTLLVLVLIIVIGLPVAWLTRDSWGAPVTKWAVNAWARHAGAEAPVIGRLAFHIDSAGPQGLVLSGIDVNGPNGLAADRIALGYQWRELVQGRLTSITAHRPSLHVTIADDGTVTFGDLEPLRALGGGGEGPSRALPMVRFTDAEITVDGAARGRVVAGGTLGETDGALGLAADGSAMLEAADWRIDGVGRLLVTLDDARTRLNATLIEARVERGDLAVEGLRGTASIDLATTGEIEAIADLRADRAQASGIDLAVPSAHLRLDPLGLSAVFRLGDRAAPDLRLAVAAGQPVDGRRSVAIDVTAELATVDRLVAAARRQPARGMTGTLAGTLRGTVPETFDDAHQVWLETVAAGSLDIDAGDPEMATRARLGLALAAGTLAIETREPALVDARISGLPEILATIIGDDPLSVVLGMPTRPFRILLTDLFKTPAVSLGGPASAETARGVSARFDGDAAFADITGTTRIDRASGTLEVTGAMIGEIRLHEARLDLTSLTATATAAAAQDAEVTAVGELTARLETAGVRGVAVRLPLRLVHDGNGTAVFLRRSGTVQAESLPTAGAITVEGAQTIRLDPSTRPALRRGFGDGDAVRIDIPFALPAATSILVAGEPPIHIALDPATGSVRGRFDGARAGAVLRLSTGKAEVYPGDEDPAAPDGIRLSTVALAVTLAGQADGVVVDKVSMSADQLTDRAANVRFAPLRVEGEARRVSPDALEFNSTFRGADGAFVLDTKGFHDLKSGNGRAYLTLFPLVFVPGGLQPVDLSPAAAAMLRNASGRVSLKGGVVWPGTAVAPDEPLTFTVEDLSFTGSLGTVSGLSGAVAVSGIDPLITPSGQVLTATAIDVGVPIAAPSVAFRLDPDLFLILEKVQARFADGTVHARDVRIPLRSDDPVAMVLDVDGVDAARLAEVSELEGLTATGSLSGSLPLVWDHRLGLSLQRARLSATTTGGTVRYQPETPPPGLQNAGEEVSLLMKAVRNLVYERFDIEADGRPGEPFDIKLRVRGANPDLFDGYPVALNVRLSGRLDELFLNARRSLGLSDIIQRKLQERGAGG